MNVRVVHQLGYQPWRSLQLCLRLQLLKLSLGPMPAIPVVLRPSGFTVPVPAVAVLAMYSTLVARR